MPASIITRRHHKRYKPQAFLDSDGGTDADDMVNYTMMATGHLMGLIAFAGIMIDSSGSFSVQAFRNCLNFNRLPNIPVYRIASSTVPNASTYMPGLANLFGSVTSVALTTTVGYRQELIKKRNSSVRIIGTGGCASMAGLLASAGDSISPISGADLISTRVSWASNEGGFWPNNRSPGSQNGGGIKPVGGNVLNDIASYQAIVAGWPANRTFNFNGDELTIGAGSTLPAGSLQSANPIMYASAIFKNAANGGTQGCYASPSILMALGIDKGSYQLSAPGSATFDGSGNNDYVAGPGNITYITSSIFGSTLTNELSRLTTLFSAHLSYTPRISVINTNFSSVGAKVWITSDPSGGGSVVSGIGPTWQATDISGNGNDFSVPTVDIPSATPPTVTANVLNGFSSWKFNGTSDILKSAFASFLNSGSQNFDIYLLAILNSVTGEKHLLDIGPAVSTLAHNVGRVMIYTVGNAYHAGRWGAANAGPGAPAGLTTGTPILFELSYNNARTGALKNCQGANGVRNILQPNGTVNSALSLTSLLLGGSLFATDAPYDATHSFASMDFFELAILDNERGRGAANLSDGEPSREHVSYFSNKYATPFGM